VQSTELPSPFVEQHSVRAVTVTAHTKCYLIDEGSFVDCTIEDTKLQKEEEEGKGES
jgi:hypothetical protein